MPCRFNSEHRGVVATADLDIGQIIVNIPRHLILTQEVAKESEIGQLMKAAGLKLDHDALLAAFVLQVQSAPEYVKDIKQPGFWKPYIDSLPQDFSNVPLFWDEERFDLVKVGFDSLSLSLSLFLFLSPLFHRVFLFTSGLHHHHNGYRKKKESHQRL